MSGTAAWRLRGDVPFRTALHAGSDLVHLMLVQVPPAAATDRSFLAPLSDDELGLLGSIPLAGGRDEFVVSRWAARGLLAEVFGTAPAAVPLRATRGRRPSLAFPAGVGWSHSEGVVATVVCTSALVAVDVEREGDHLAPLTRRFVSASTSAADAAPAWVAWEARRKLGAGPTHALHRRLVTAEGRRFSLGVAVSSDLGLLPQGA